MAHSNNFVTQEQSEYQVVTRDVWNMLLPFIEQHGNDLSTFEEGDECMSRVLTYDLVLECCLFAGPVLIDMFVVHLKAKRGAA